MLLSRILEIGPQAFGAGMKSRKRPPRESGAILGALDTECVSRSGKFLCAQIAVGRRVVLLDRKPSIETLHRTALDLANADRGDVALACWFSVADVRHFQPWGQGSRFFVGPRGSLDVCYDTPWGELRLWDLQRFYAPVGMASLAQAARYYGLRKKEWDRANVKRADLASARFRSYARHDATITLHIAEKTARAFAKQGVDILIEKTAASAASTIYRSFYLKRDVPAPLAPVRRLALRASWGGRAEAFARGVFPEIHEYDYASAYPRACLSLRVVPCAEDWRSAVHLGDFQSGNEGLVDCEFSFPSDQRHPCLPVATENMLLFPSSGRSYCTGAEARRALELGAVVQLHEGYVFHDGDKSLAEYMAAMLKWRLEAGDEAERAVAKLCANSLTGKLIQNRGGLHVEKILTKLAEIGLDWTEAGELSDEMWTALGLDARPRCGAAWAPEWYALITGFVRGRLAEDIARTDPVYVSTDSLWAKEWNDRPDDVADKGKGTAMVLRSRLAILTNGERVLHAARHGAHRPLAPALYLKLLKRGQATCKYRRPIMPRESLRYGKELGKFHGISVRVASDWDHKRALLADGSTRPWKSVEEFYEHGTDGRNAARAPAHVGTAS